VVGRRIMPIPEKVWIPAPKDPNRKHFYYSIVKSLLRIGGCVALLGWRDIGIFALAFLLAEVLGIMEEL
jgi:hypothetical protein